MRLRSVFTGNLVRAPDTGAGAGADPAPASSALNVAPPAGAGAASLAAGLTPATTAGTTQATPPVSEKPWYSDLPEAYHPTITAKGWKSPNDVLESYVNLEKLFGADRAGNTLTKPKADATPEEKAAFYRQLGVPEKPEGYEIGKVQGFDRLPPALQAEARTWLHGANVPPDVAANLTEQMIKANDAKLAEFSKRAEMDLNRLALEFGPEADNKFEMGRRAVRSLGLSEGDLAGMEMAVGTEKLMRMFIRYGENTREAGTPDPSQGGAPSNTFQPSRADAQAAISRLKADPDFQSRYLSPNPAVRNAAIEEMEKWHKMLG